MRQKLLTFIFLFGFWMLLSGKTDIFHLALGVISTLIVTLWSSHCLFTDDKKKVGNWLGYMLGLITYSFWLLWEIIIANLHVIKVVLSPNLYAVLDPQIVEFKTKLKTDNAKFILANSITLTPGTVTVKVDKDTFIIHALTQNAADGVPGDMAKKVAKIFGEAS